MATEGKGPIVIPCYLVSGVPYVLEIDANGKLAVRAAEIETLLAGGLPAALDSGALKVKEQATVTVQAAGGDKPLSLESVVNDRASNTNLAAGVVSVASSSVPIGKLWVVTHLSWLYYGTMPGRIILRHMSGATPYEIHEWAGGTSGQWYGYPCQLYIPAGDNLDVQFVNATLGDDGYFITHGHQMDAP